jgi:hypothetical protein
VNIVVVDSDDLFMSEEYLSRPLVDSGERSHFSVRAMPKLINAYTTEVGKSLLARINSRQRLDTKGCVFYWLRIHFAGICHSRGGKDSCAVSRRVACPAERGRYSESFDMSVPC